MVRITFMVPEALKKRFHVACIDNSEHMSERVTKLIEGWLAKPAPPKKAGKR